MVAQGAQVAYLESVERLLSIAGLDAVPQAQVVAVDCAYISPSQPREVAEGFTLYTLWGEIAYRLVGDAGYELVRQSDQDRVAPGSDALKKLFQLAGPSLILIDETLSYITKASGIAVGRGYLSDQALEFLGVFDRTDLPSGLRLRSAPLRPRASPQALAEVRHGVRLQDPQVSRVP